MMVGRLLHSRGRRLTAIIAVAVIALTAFVSLQASAGPAPITTRDFTIPVPGGPGVGGTIDLDASLYLPASTPAPAVIVAHGFGGSKDSVSADAERLARAGFVVLAYSARGFGRSGGLIGLDSLDYEVADARALVSWLGHRPEVTMDGPDDPRVGVTGGSYGGALALMLAGTDRRVDAVAAVATWNDLAQALFPNPIMNTKVGSNPPDPSNLVSPFTPAYQPDWPDGVFKQAWTASLLTSVMAGSPPSSVPGEPKDLGVSCGRLMPAICAAYVQVAQTGRLSPAMSALLAKSSPAQVVSHITAPTLLAQGEQDTLFGLDQADANARAITAAGTPVAVSWYPGGHSGAGVDDATETRITDWMRYYLSGVGPQPSRAFQYSVAGPVSQRGTPRVRTLSLPTYPGLDGTTTHDAMVPISGPPQVIVNPPGGKPAAITSLPGFGGLASSALAGLGALPGQSATFTSPTLTTPLVMTGSATVGVTVSRLPTPGATSTADTSAVLFLSVTAVDSAAGEPASTASRASGAAGGDTADTVSTADGGTSGGSPDSTDIAGAVLGTGPAGGAVSAIRIPDVPADGTPVNVEVRLPAVAFQVAAGKSLGVRVATTDQGYFGSTVPAAYRVSIGPVAAGDTAAPTERVTVPAVGGTGITHDENPLGWAIGLGAVVLAGLLALFLAGRTRGAARRSAASAVSAGAESAGTDTAGTDSTGTGSANVGAIDTGMADAEPADMAAPLTVEHLQKVYPGGVAAVSDVSFTVRPGQVLGLLGPNGAGKTTTLRMVMGLITPSAGQIRLFGEEVRPGAAVLSRVGSFVEGSGFLPHLSGQRNLDLYWRTTNRPASESFMAQALQIAGLGDAVKRTVRTYSQGMRQRLAIAQAMLGLPELLILDEPTNGLDPPQIHAMREVLRRYAATGRTVVVSSHLLSEVEQTCTDVVIVAGGRTIAAGTVAELVAHSGELAITTTKPDQARATLAALAGVGDTDLVAGGLVVDRRSVPVETIMRALLDAGVPVSAIAPRNRLEEVFLNLVAAGSGGMS